MKIRKIIGIPLFKECPTIYDAMSATSSRKALLVKIETDKGLWGIGEAFLYGCSPKAGKEILDTHFVPLLEGLDVSDIEKIWKICFWNTTAFGKRGIILGIISGIDIALWDLKAKSEKVPLYILLAGKADRIASYASGGFYAEKKDLVKFRAELEGYKEKGYEKVKIKMGRNSDRTESPLDYSKNTDNRCKVETDFQRLEIATTIFGKGNVAVDSNCSWTPWFITEYSSIFKEQKVWWLEEPILAENISGLKSISEALKPIPIAGYETEQRYEVFEKLIMEGVIDILQPDIGWAGGITECLKIGRLGLDNNKKISLHSFGSAVHFAASLHLSSALPTLEKIESEENFNPLRSEIVLNKLEHDEEMSFFIPQGDGLGLDIDWDKIESLSMK